MIKKTLKLTNEYKEHMGKEAIEDNKKFQAKKQAFIKDTVLPAANVLFKEMYDKSDGKESLRVTTTLSDIHDKLIIKTTPDYSVTNVSTGEKLGKKTLVVISNETSIGMTKDEVIEYGKELRKKVFSL